MAKVICTLPNAAEEISGVKFAKHEDGGMISETISDERAALFASINGYKLLAEAKPAAVAVDTDDDELTALKARAAELGVDVDTRWKAARLTAEIEKAERAAKAAADADQKA